MQKNNKLYIFIISLLSTWAAQRACAISTLQMFTLIFFVGSFLLYDRFFRWEQALNATRSYKIASVIISSLFTLFTLIGDSERLLSGLENKLFRLAHLVIIGLGLFFLFYALVLGLYLVSEHWKLCGSCRPHLPAVTFVACLVCWLPYLITNFPGVMTVDSLNQYGQIIGALPYSNHHPWVHTQLIRLFYETGCMLTHDPIIGLGLYTIFQMCVLAGIYAYLMGTLVKQNVKTGICLVVLAFYAILPYNGIYAVTMWKDILFSGMVLLYSCALLRFLDRQRFACRTFDGVLYVLSGIGMCLLRSNGWYAFLVTLPIVLFLLRRQWKIHVPLNLLILAVVLIVKIPVMNACHVAQPDFVESLSIPVQLAARVYADGETVSEEDDKLWNQMMDTGKIADVYYPYCSDNIKNLIREGDQEYLAAHKGDYLKLWIRFGIEHPAAYFRGYVDATKGYWYPDVPNLIGSNEGIAENEYGLDERPIFRNPLTVKIKEIVFKLQDMVPVYGLLFSPGALFWLAILFAGKLFADKSFRNLAVFVPNAAIMATLFVATPVYNEFRYAYSLILTLPLFFAAAFCHDAPCGTAAQTEQCSPR